MSDTVGRVRLALDCARTRHGVSVIELATKLGITEGSASRLASALAQCELLERDPATNRYSLGLALTHLGRAAIEQRPLTIVARRHLEELIPVIKSSVSVAVPRGNRAMYLDFVEFQSDDGFTVPPRPGRTLPFHTTALGKAILAGRPADEVARVLDDCPLPELTVHTITSKEALQKELAQIAAQGFAIDDEESRLGTRCIAAPVCGEDGYTIAAISSSNSTHFMTDARIEAIRGPLQTAARRISRALGSPESG
ncbi:IclR family transcriptional regulator [Pseudofrankia asymbiotica]|uniref:IclR-ED domain-containing protein n=1 Tax=Pseudofrankia asymbiotica TaxID=1834516 RepID=A0A1V2I6G3_9ACTN|nr:IclR family transcriptional regulator [Pseudofrankia asymbiotica]ONH26408.1 hypothetical protein BL253_24815 [Pseudofrankia asymbiotica]